MTETPNNNRTNDQADSAQAAPDATPQAPAPPPQAAAPPAQAPPPPPPTPPAPPEADAPPAVSPAMQADMDQAMKAATEGPAGPPDTAQAKEAAKAQPAGDDAAHGDKPKAIRGPRVVQGGREYRTGKVVSVGPDDIFIEFGPKELGVCPRTQYKDDELPKVGEDLQVAIERFNAEESLFMCAKPGAVQKADWELLEPGQIVEAVVTGHNKGGLELEVAKHRAFMPASHIDIRRIDDLSQFTGQKLTCQVTKVDRFGKGNITLSRRSILKKEQKENLAKLKETLKEGDTIQGTVKKLMPFGAFVDMGGIDGLLHVGDMSHERIDKPETVVKEGDEVTVKVLKLDWENDRHSLGLKQLTEHPWDSALKDIKEGDEISGRVTKLLDFGAFIEVVPGVEGLCHISELAWQRVNRTSDVVQPNQVVKAKILSVDTDSRKISLSIKQTSEKPVQKGARPGGGGRGRRGEEERDTRTPDEILKETPELRRLREQAKKKTKKNKTGSGLGSAGGMGMGLGDLGKLLGE